MSFTRARKPEQKEHRRAHILQTARAVLQSGTPLRELSLNALAREAEMTKSNLYRYFESREDVLIALLRDEWSAWFDAVASGWRAPRKSVSPLRALARHLAHTLAERPLLCELTSVLPAVLEHNLNEESIARFKRETLAFFMQLGAFLASKVPELSPMSAAQFLGDGAACVSGLWPYAHPAPAVARVIASTPELRVFMRDFEADLARFLYALVVDLTAETGASERTR